ncbi:Hypothetical protein SSCIU_00842 [Mammaliicoccus sciuri]|jgi:hypothetical protein
MDL